MSANSHKRTSVSGCVVTAREAVERLLDTADLLLVSGTAYLLAPVSPAVLVRPLCCHRRQPGEGIWGIAVDMG